jgi:hypothetical protein
MKLKIISVIVVIFSVFTSTVLGQGRVDTDSIVNNIWWKSLKIDNDTTIKYGLTSTLAQNGSQDLIAFYTNRDTVYKIVRLAGDAKGTQMTTFYFSDSTPILISIKRNNYSFSPDKKVFSNMLTSFEDVVDTSRRQNVTFSKNHYQAKYYYNKRQLYYSNVRTGNTTRVDKNIDKDEGLISFAEAEQYFGMFTKVKNSLEAQ